MLGFQRGYTVTNVIDFSGRCGECRLTRFHTSGSFDISEIINSVILLRKTKDLITFLIEAVESRIPNAGNTTLVWMQANRETVGSIHFDNLLMLCTSISMQNGLHLITQTRSVFQFSTIDGIVGTLPGVVNHRVRVHFTKDKPCGMVLIGTERKACDFPSIYNGFLLLCQPGNNFLTVSILLRFKLLYFLCQRCFLNFRFSLCFENSITLGFFLFREITVIGNQAVNARSNLTPGELYFLTASFPETHTLGIVILTTAICTRESMGVTTGSVFLFQKLGFFLRRMTFLPVIPDTTLATGKATSS